MQQQQQQEPISNILYRLETVEKKVIQVEGQLRDLPQSYVQTRENEWRLQNIQDSVKRIETDISDIKKQHTDLATKLATQESDARNRESQQRESQDKLQIRVLWGIVSTIVTIVSLVLVAYLTHFIH